MTAYVVKCLKRIPWPHSVLGEEMGEVRAHIIYELGGCLSADFRDSLFLFRQAVVAVEKSRPGSGKGHALAEAFVDDQFLRTIDVGEALKNATVFRVVACTNDHWQAQVIKSIGSRLRNNRFNPKLYVFRTQWPRVLERAEEEASSNQKNESIRIQELFDTWLDTEGWKWGVSKGDYDGLNTQAVLDDQEVDEAFRGCGFESLNQFLEGGRFSMEVRGRICTKIMERVMLRITSVIEETQ